jgi:sugar transferase (PEP-CTERM/EpsH1 system associated)
MNWRNVQPKKSYVIVHVVFRLDYGGLENGLVNVIKTMAGSEFQHVVISLTESTDFAERLPDGVKVYTLHKKPGKDLGAYWRLFRLIREIRPHIVHTRNFGTLDCAAVAFFAGVPIRVHGEHGWDITDPDGVRVRYQRIRRILCKLVDRVITVSKDLEDWIVGRVGIPQSKVLHIYNGVDTERFSPAQNERKDDSEFVIGSVTRFAEIKDPLNVVSAYLMLREDFPTVSLIVIGDGPLYDQATDMLKSHGVESNKSLIGFRDDVTQYLKSMNVFVLGSKREGISNTILEAMATGLPVVATNTGGNKELVTDDATGFLVPTEDPGAIASAIARYLEDPKLAERHGREARRRAEEQFSVETMVGQYISVYRDLVAARGL